MALQPPIINGCLPQIVKGKIFNVYPCLTAPNLVLPGVH